MPLFAAPTQFNTLVYRANAFIAARAFSLSMTERPPAVVVRISPPASPRSISLPTAPAGL